MINTLYSLLVSGAGDIPDTFEHYRRHTPIAAPVYGIPVHGDPHSQALWANYIIAMAKISPLYPELQALDPINTYDDITESAGRVTITDGCFVVAIYNACPVVTGSYSVSYTEDLDSKKQVLVTSGDGSVSVLAVPADDTGTNYLADLPEYCIKFPYGSTKISVDIYNPAVPLQCISKADISRMYKYIPTEVYQSMDIDSVYDRACVFSIALLSSYRSI